jgi:chorismate mutase / prephenate dehydratase
MAKKKVTQKPNTQRRPASESSSKAAPKAAPKAKSAVKGPRKGPLQGRSGPSSAGQGASVSTPDNQLHTSRIQPVSPKSQKSGEKKSPSARKSLSTDGKKHADGLKVDPAETGGIVGEGVKGGAERPDDSAALKTLRTTIDKLDAKLVKLLNERSKAVVEVGRLKRGRNVPIYAPHREREVLDRALRLNEGPLSGRTIEAVYRELMSGSFALEQPLRIGYLGPPGSYSHLASQRHFGSSVTFENMHEIAGVFTEVRRGHVDYGLAPIENSTGGGVAETLDAFQKNRDEVTVYAEVHLAVHHALLANCPPAAVRRIHSKPEAFSQCRQWLATQYPSAQLIPAASSSAAAQTAAEENRIAISIGADPGSGAIGSTLAGSLYGLAVLFEKIEDNPNNVTRFAVISRQKALPSGDDKTSIMFNTVDKPGALVDVLAVFRDAGVNLTYIHERPAGGANWTYTFFVDAEGHRDAEPLKSALVGAERYCKALTVLGSYPRSRRIL